MHDRDLLAIHKQVSHNYSESFDKPCAHLLCNSPTSSNKAFICLQIISSCTS